MRTIAQHIVRFLTAAGLSSLLALTAAAQTATGTHIDNVGSLRYGFADGTRDSLATSLVRVTVEPASYRLDVEKTATRDSVMSGEVFDYAVRVTNQSRWTLSGVVVTDTIDGSRFDLLSASSGLIEGTVVRYVIGTLAPGSSDSLRITVRVRPDTTGGAPLLNTAYATSLETGASVVQSQAVVSLKKAPASTTWRIRASAAPALVIGNGIAVSVLRGTVTDTLGNPKPDGALATLRTTAGTFSNGLDSIVVPLIGGVAVDSVKALITSNSIVTARATITVEDPVVGRDSAAVDIVFYPGAITGMVVNNITHLPEEGALVQVYASDGTLIGTTTTGPDGSYLVPVPQTDTYEVRIQTYDDFGQPMNTVTTVHVSIPSVGGNPPVRNSNVISGRVFYLVSQKPVAFAGIKVVLTKIPGGGSVAADGSFRSGRAMVDSTFTDTTGSCSFSGLPVGDSYAVSIDDAHLRGTVAVDPLTPGTYLTNVNIPITLNSTLDLVKTGPARAYRRDTVSYSIDVRNRGTLSMTSASLTDSLDRSMRFVSSVPAPTSVDTMTGVVRWAFGQLDSSAGPASARNIVVRVRFADTTATGRILTNTASFSSDQTTDTSVTATTELFETELVVSKTAARPIVEIGDVEVYSVSVRNATPLMPVLNVILEDRPPLGFSYVAGSSFRDTMRLPDPAIVRTSSGVILRWSLSDSLPAGEVRAVTYRMIVGAGAAEGDGINRAMAFANAPNGVALRSAVAEARVEVQRGIFTDRGLVIGKVFHDPNNNSYQDPGEEGVKGVELVTEDGTRIVTGDDGKYSIPDIAPGEHVIRIRQHTLPAGSSLHGGSNDFAGDAMSRFVTVPAGGIARVDFYLDAPAAEDTLTLSQHYLRFGGLTVRRTVAPRNVVFIDDERRALMKLTGLNFEVGKAVLRPESFPVIAQLAKILREHPEERVTIVGHTDASPIRTSEFPNNRVLSLARAEAVKAVLVDHEGVDLLRIATLGYGESVPAADNTTSDGRALNRRVEFAFGPVVDRPKPRDSVAIMVTIPIAYDGSSHIGRLEWTDSLAAGLRYVSGSAGFGGRPVEPEVRGSILRWRLDSLSAPLNASLIYQVIAGRPTQRIEDLPSRSHGFRVTTADSNIICSDELSTVNQMAVALPGRAFNFVMPSVLFETARAELRPGAESALETMATMMVEDPALTLIVEGHTDARAIRSREFSSNLELSQARAGSIVDMLAARFGIERARMAAVGFGEHRPIATNQTVEGRQQNRRVELRLFRSEFWTSVLKEGGVDSSRQARISVRPTIPDVADRSVGMIPGERYLAVFEARWNGSGIRPSDAVLVDTLPSWFTVDHATIRSTGLDSVAMRSPLFARMQTSRPLARVSFEFVAEGSAMPVIPTVRQFSFIRRSRTGQQFIQHSPHVLIGPAR